MYICFQRYPVLSKCFNQTDLIEQEEKKLSSNIPLSQAELVCMPVNALLFSNVSMQLERIQTVEIKFPVQ